MRRRTPLRTRLLRALVCIAPLLACSPGDDEEESTTNSTPQTTNTAPAGNVIEYTRSFNVDCLGMSVTTVSNSAYGETRAPLFGDLTISEQDILAAFGDTHPIATVPRCGYWFEPPFDAGAVTLLNLENFTFNTQNTGMMKIAYDGQMWTPHYGDLYLDPGATYARATGWYDAVFKGTSGEYARIQGDFEWCEPAMSDDCAGSVQGELPYPFEVELPGHAATFQGPTFGWGTASQCRAMIDPATSGMRIDMQVAFWKHAAVTELYGGACDNIPVDLMNFNHLVFETGGVTGPGSYGPVAVHDYAGTSLPRLDFETPFSFLYAGFGFSPIGFCALSQGGFARGHATTTPQSVCEYTIEEGVGGAPGQVWLSCSEVYHHFPGGEINNDRTGLFDLWAACDVVTL